MIEGSLKGLKILLNTQKLKSWTRFLLLLVAISWGATFFIVQDAIENTPIYTFLFWRFGIAFLVLGSIFYKKLIHIDKQTLIAGGVLGFFMFLGYAFQTFALLYTYSSTVGFLTGLNVIMVPFILFVLFHKRASIFSIFGAILATIGLYFLSFDSKVGFGIGEIYSLVCAFMFALHIVYTDKFSKNYDILSLVVIQFFTVAWLSFCFALFFKDEMIPTFDKALIKALVITILFATIFAFWVQTAMQNLPSNKNCYHFHNRTR